MKRFTNRLNFGAKRMKMALVGAIYNINLAMQGEAYLRKIALKRFKKKLGRTFDWDNPRTLNEIITRNKIDSDTTLWSRLADKYAVREYIEERGYGKTLIELYGIWSSAKDIDFEQLPSSFIIKNTNGCAKYMIVRDKSQINIGMSRDRIASWLYNRFGYISVEPHYLRIEPRIIAERLLTAPAEDTLQANSLIDYKWYCFNGHATYAFVTSNRTQKSHSYEVSMYDTQWNDHSH